MTDIDEGLLAVLAPHGRLRAAINLGNAALAQRDAGTGELGGVSVALARELARRLGRELELVAFDGAGKVFAARDDDRWDIAFLAIDPLRAQSIAYTPPYVIIEGTFAVRADSPIRQVADADRPGQRLLVAHNSAYDLFLSKSLAHAEIVRAPTPAQSLEQFVASDHAAVAGVRQTLEAFFAERSGYRILADSFTTIQQAMAVAHQRRSALGLLAGFIEEQKRSGFVRAALDRSGRQDVAVAPPA